MKGQQSQQLDAYGLSATVVMVLYCFATILMVYTFSQFFKMKQAVGGNFLALFLFGINFFLALVVLGLHAGLAGFELMQLAFSQSAHKFRIDPVCSYSSWILRKKVS